MLNYAVTASRSTIVPLVSVPCSQPQKRIAARATSPSVSPTSSYTIGPIDPAQITTMHAHLSSGEECTLLVPVHLPSSILTHPMFKDGYEWGYLEGVPEEEEYTVPKLVNETITSSRNFAMKMSQALVPGPWGSCLWNWQT